MGFSQECCCLSFKVILAETDMTISHHEIFKILSFQLKVFKKGTYFL